MDYSPHTAKVPEISVQFDDGEVVTTSDETVIQSAKLQDSPEPLNGVPIFEIPGKSSRTLMIRVDIAARMNAEAGLKLRSILLYGEHGFRGFVPIPDDVRQRIAAIADNGSASVIEDNGRPSAASPGPAARGAPRPTAPASAESHLDRYIIPAPAGFKAKPGAPANTVQWSRTGTDRTVTSVYSVTVRHVGANYSLFAPEEAKVRPIQAGAITFRHMSSSSTDWLMTTNWAAVDDEYLIEVTAIWDRFDPAANEAMNAAVKKIAPKPTTP
jgi:hypothetical protein